MTDIEINKSCNKKPIYEIAKKLELNEIDLECYGNYKAKINYKNYLKKQKFGKLILVTSIHPTPYGEGKTTLVIGINDALQKLNQNSVAVLREPSLGPVFGIKGGATGGGYSQVVPMEDVNLHFTGDMHAITTCNNLLCSIIDNHIFQGNELNINPETICFHRCLDINDRILRNVNLENRKEKFQITAASEIMAILCLSKDINDLRNKLGSILIGYTYDNKAIFARDLNCIDSLIIVLKDALKPNLVQSLENNPVIIHGGPFANIAHGCNSLIATNLGLALSDYVITEAGFGSDLGAEKFLNIKCRNDLNPSLIIINVTIKALKYNGYASKEEINIPNIEYLKKGICNLEAHINNLKKFTNQLLVVLNRFDTDSDEEIIYVKNFVNNLNVDFEISDAYSKGSNGAIDVAKKVIELANKENNFKFLYDLNDSIENKINTICREIYHAKSIFYNEQAKLEIKKIDKLGFSNLPICIAKTQYSFSDDSKKLGNPKDFEVTVQNISLKSGAGFIVVFLGNIIDMPGLSKNPNALYMTIDENENVEGLF